MAQDQEKCACGCGTDSVGGTPLTNGVTSVSVYFASGHRREAVTQILKSFFGYTDDQVKDYFGEN